MIRAWPLVLLIGTAGCALDLEAQGDADVVASCPSSFDEIGSLVGDWSQSIVADEGWPGEGQSTITLQRTAGCVLSEKGGFTLYTDDGPVVSSSATQIAYDSLSKSWKLLSTDSRGFTHIGVGGPVGAGEWAFDIIRETGEPGRRISYRGLSPDGFEWIWQGQDDTGNWLDRLVISYKTEGGQRSEN